MTTARKLTRRQVLKGTAAVGALGMLGGLGWLGKAWGAQDKVKMGFIFVGPRDDYGYNQAHYEGKSAVAKLDWVKAVDEEKVPETIEVQKTMESMIKLDGVQVLFPTSFGYFDPHILKVAPQFPNVRFLHCGGLYQEGKHPKNAGSYFGYIDEPEYVAGIVAGGMTKSGKLGIYCTGYHVNQSKLAPRGYLTGAEWNWAKLYMDYADMIRKGTEVPHLIRGGLKEGIVKVSDYNQVVTESVRKQADAAKAKFMSGAMVVYKGPIKDNTGNVVIPAGEEYIQTDIRLESMGWLVEGVIGSTKS